MKAPITFRRTRMSESRESLASSRARASTRTCRESRSPLNRKEGLFHRVCSQERHSPRLPGRWLHVGSRGTLFRGFLGPGRSLLVAMKLACNDVFVRKFVAGHGRRAPMLVP